MGCQKRSFLEEGRINEKKESKENLRGVCLAKQLKSREWLMTTFPDFLFSENVGLSILTRLEMSDKMGKDETFLTFVICGNFSKK